MAKPTARTEAGGSKIVVLADSTATTPDAATPVAVVKASSAEATYPVAWQGVATHEEGEAMGAAGNNGGTGAFSSWTGNPVVAIAGKTSGNAIAVPIIATTTPGGSDQGMVTRNIPSGTQTVSVTGTATVSVTGTATVSGTVTANQGGTWNVGTLTSLTNALPAGTNVIGGARKSGWDAGSLAVQRGLAIGVTATTETTLLSADASNLYNIMDINVSVFAGTTAPSALRYLTFRHGVAGTEFLRVYCPRTADGTLTEKISFEMPDRGSVNQAVTVQLSGALGTSGEYSVNVHGYKTTS